MNTFDFQGHSLRAIELDGEPWFVAADACRCLGLKAHTTSGAFTHHLGRLDKSERRLVLTSMFHVEVRGPNVTAISESGLYKLIMRANPSRPEVAAFQNWVTKEVLPSIRKTGGYLLNEHARETAHADTKDAMP